MLGFSLFLRLRMALGFGNGGAAPPPPGTLDFSKAQNSALIILLEDF
jgi:hypothetical protein